MKLMELIAVMGLQSNDFESGIKRATKKGSDFAGTIVEKVSAGTVALGNLMADAAKTAMRATADVVKNTMDLTSSLEQNIGGSEAVWSDFADKVQKTGRDAYKNLGLSLSDYLATANKMGSLLKGSGFETDEAFDLTTQAMQRAADVASVMGIDVSWAMESIAGAAKGNFTMMDNLGVAINDTTLASYALEKGITKSTRSMTTQEKVALAMELFLERTAYAAGNYAKENETMAGALTTAKAALDNFLTGQIGVEEFVGTMEDTGRVLFRTLSEVVPRLWQSTRDAVIVATPKIMAYMEKWGSIAYNAGADLIAEIYNGITGDNVTGNDIKIFLAELFSDGKTAAHSLVEVGSTLMRDIQSAITGDPQSVSEITEVFSKLFDAGVDAATGLLSVGSTLLADLYATITGDEKSAEQIKTYMHEIFAGTGTVLTGLKDAGLDVLKWILDNGETLAPIAAGLGTSLGLLALGANPLGTALSAAALGIAALSTDWDEFAEKAPHLVELFEDLTGLEFADFKAGVEGVKESLAALGEWYIEHQILIATLLAAVGGLAVAGGQPIIGIGLMAAAESILSAEPPLEEGQIRTPGTLWDPNGKAVYERQVEDIEDAMREYYNDRSGIEEDPDFIGPPLPPDDDDDGFSGTLDEFKATINTMPDIIRAAIENANIHITLSTASVANTLTPHISANLARRSRTASKTSR